MDFTKSENFYATNCIIKKQKDDAQNGRKIFINHVSDKKVVSKLYKKLLQLNTVTTQ